MKGSWLKRTHECSFPSPGKSGIGSEWQCKCGRTWRLTEKRWSGAYLVTNWRPLP